MILVNEFRPVSRLEVPNEPLLRAKFPVIDMHSHLLRTADSTMVLDRMNRFNIRMIVDMDGFWDERMDFQLEHYVNRYPDRFSIFCRVDMLRVDAPDFAGYVRHRLADCAAKGAAGIKVSKSLGLKLKSRDGRYLKPDDDRLRIVWEEAAKHDFPVTIHIGDPPCFFDRVIDGKHERYEELAEHPDWAYGSRPCPRFNELMEAQENLLYHNPDTRFVIAHIGSHAENLKEVSRQLETYPNMYVDTAERISELGRQPYTARDFLIRWQDRVIYGTDLIPNETNVSGYYRFFETKDEYFPYNSWDEHHQGRWNIYGVYLPDEVLRKIYYKNALKAAPRLADLSISFD
ncbi:MAG: amidohydrolase family protein [Eubacteriales bacterium]